MGDHGTGSTPANDLKSLATAAAHAAESARASAARVQHQQLAERGRRSAWVRHGGWLLWAVAIAVWGWQLRFVLMPNLNAESDLAVILGEARNEIEAALKATGQLPERLPSPSLTLVVRYQVIDANAKPPTYRLEGTLGSASQTWTNAR